MSTARRRATGAAADAVAAARAHRSSPTASRAGSSPRTPRCGVPSAEAEAANRLSGPGSPRTSRPLVGEIAALRDELAAEGVDHVVLCGMGGSSLAPEVICATAGVPLVVLDSTDPD